MKKTILIVDDEEWVCKSYERGFLNFNVLAFTDHLQGLGKLQELIGEKKAPDAVILDFRLEGQGTDGGKLAERIRDEYDYKGEIFLVSGILNKNERIAFRQKHSYTIINKSNSLEDIIDCIEDRILIKLDKDVANDGVVATVGHYILKAQRVLEGPDISLPLQNQVYQTLSLLMARPETLVSGAEIMDTLKGDEDPDLSESYVRSIIKRVRKTLEVTDLEIVMKRGHGWYISHQKAKL